MSVQQVGQVLARADVPAEVQCGLLAAFPSAAPALARNPSLALSAWEALYASGPCRPLGDLLARRLPPPAWSRLVSDLASGTLSAADEVEVDRALARALVEGDLPLDLVPLLLSRPGPEVASALLTVPLDGPDLLRAVRALGLAERLWWLASPAADGLEDDEVWDLVSSPDPFPSQRARPLGSLLLFRRPALRARALSGPLFTLEMVVCVELDPSEQFALVNRCAPLASDPFHRNVLAALVDAPWCTREAGARAAALLGHGVPRRPTSPVPLADASWWHLRRLTRHLSRAAPPRLDRGLSPWPCALLELARNPRLRGASRRRVVACLSSSWARELGPAADDLLADLGAPRRPVPSPFPAALRFRGGRPGPSLWDELWTPTLAEALEVPALEANEDALKVAFSSIEGDLALWETALVLLRDDFEGSLCDLLAAARLLA